MRFSTLINHICGLLFLLIMSSTAIAAVKIAGYSFDETDWHLTGTALDSIGGHDGVVNGSIGRNRSDSATAHLNTCASASFGGGSIDISGLPVSTTAGDKTTLSFWMYWTGANSVMPVGWNVHDLWMVNGDFGFNTGAGDIYGISSAGLANGWHHVVAEFTNNNILNNKIYIDGVDQVLTQRRNTPNNARAVVQSSLRLGGWYITNGYRFSGFLDEVNVYNGALTQAEVDIDLNYIHVGACPADPAPQPEQLIASYNFNDDWSSASPLLDGVGTANGNVSGNITKVLSPASGNKPETCAAGNFNGGAIDIFNLPVSTNVGDKTSISFWMNWNGTNSVMPLGWRYHDLWFYAGNFGFNTARGDIYGIASNPLRNVWSHVTVVFTNNSVYENKIYIDGVEQVLTQRRSTVNNARAVVDQHLRIGGWWGTNGYRFRGQLDEIKIYTGEINQATVDANLIEISNCYEPLATWHMDEISWGGVADEVVDETGNNRHGTSQNGTSTTQIGPAIVGDPGSCGLSQFDGIDDYIALPSIPNLTGSFTLTAWIKSTKSTRGRIFADDDNNQRGYALSLNEPSSGKLRFYSRGINPVILDTSSVVLPQDNSWYFVSAVHNASSKQRFIYVNGVLEASGTYTGSWGTDSGLASIGSETNASGEGVNFAPFGGNIDEMQIFEAALTQSQIQSVMAETHACPVLPAIDHFEIFYPDSALTCTPASVTVKACTNADCSALYIPDVDVTLSPPVGWISNPVTISNGSVTLDLTHTVAENVTVDITASSIVPANSLQCIEGLNPDPTCSINFSDTGFVFDVPALTACKSSADVTIRAVKKSDTGVQCVGALAGTQTIDFWSTYMSPNTGTLPVSIAGTNIDTATPGTPIDLFFDINGEARFTTTYDDAGQLQLNAKHITVGGLVLEGDDTFVSKPVMLAAFSDDANADCASGDATCTQFKKAGELFNLKVNAACWTHDADTDFSDNPVTPNFELIGIATDHNIVTPAGGVTGTHSVSTFNFVLADNGSHTISQSVSEVGVFTFSVSTANYLGETLTFADSPNIGRFYPDHFEATTANNGTFGSNACTGFSYSGQAFTYQTSPQLTLTAYNTENPAVITRNYTGAFAKIATSDFNVTAPTTDAIQLGADGANLVRLNWAADVASLTDNSNGSHTFSFGNDSYTYLHEANSRIAPFTNAVDLVFTAIIDSDNVQTNALPHTVQPAGEPIRFGRLNIANTHGSELIPLPVSINAEMFNGINWISNTLDQCTVLNLATHLQLSNASTSGGSWRAGTSSMMIGSGTTSGVLTNNSPLLSGQATLTLSAPGEDNQGYVDIRSQLSANRSWLLGDFDNDGAYDDDASGRASFGVFKGSDTIIFRREVY